MSLNPFNKIEDFATRRFVEGFARDGAKLFAAYLVTHGWVAESQTSQLIELTSGLLLFAYAQYESYRAKQHAETEVKVALKSPEDTPRAEIAAVAKAAS